MRACFRSVQEALGQLVGAAREGLLALSVEVGLGVLRELLEEEVVEVVSPKGRWNRERAAVRHGHEDGGVTLGVRHARRARCRRSARGPRAGQRTIAIPDGLAGSIAFVCKPVVRDGDSTAPGHANVSRM